MQYPEDTIEVFLPGLRKQVLLMKWVIDLKKEEYLWEKKLMSGVQINPQDKVDV